MTASEGIVGPFVFNFGGICVSWNSASENVDFVCVTIENFIEFDYLHFSTGQRRLVCDREITFKTQQHGQ